MNSFMHRVSKISHPVEALDHPVSHGWIHEQSGKPRKENT